MRPRGTQGRKRTRGRPFALLLMTLLLASACGTDEYFPPVLTDIRYQSSAYRAGFNLGEAALTGVVDFQDPDGDVVLLHVQWQDCGSGPVRKLEILQEDFERTVSGSIPFIIVISTNCPVGLYTVRVSVSDGQGNSSNTMEALYEIYVPE